MEIKYDGKLGKFSYDDSLFHLADDESCLKYIGSIKAGCMIGKIPEGVKICDHMFEGNHYLQVGPILPESCISANHMFRDCSHLKVFPDINLALMESDDFDANTMFVGCKDLIQLCIHVSEDGSRVKHLHPYVCACKRSRSYARHLANMEGRIGQYNNFMKEESKVLHPIKYWLHKKKNISEDFDASTSINVPSKIPEILFDKDPQLVQILHDRNNNKKVELKRQYTKGKGKTEKDNEEIDENNIEFGKLKSSEISVNSQDTNLIYKSESNNVNNDDVKSKYEINNSDFENSNLETICDFENKNPIQKIDVFNNVESEKTNV